MKNRNLNKTPILIYKWIKRIFLLIFLLIIITDFATPYIKFVLQRSIENQISYLNHKFKNGLSYSLQNEYPEGELFGNLIFALSIIKYSKYDKSIQTNLIEEAILRTVSDSAKSHFSEELPLKFGAFYNGWINFTIKKYIESEIFQNSNNKKLFINLYKEFSKRIIESQKDSTDLLETYAGSIYPADNLVCIASLSSKEQELKNLRLKKIFLEAKSNTGLINHSGAVPDEIRGSSLALIAYLLNDIDKELAIKNFENYKPLFINNIIGVSLVKEYLTSGQSPDVDSGPVIFGYGSVATIMNCKTMATLNVKGAKSTWGFLNFIGIPINLFGQKYYLFKQQPMFDIFMLWISVDLINEG